MSRALNRGALGALLMLIGCGGSASQTAHGVSAVGISHREVVIGKGQTYAGTHFVATLLIGTKNEQAGRSVFKGEVMPKSSCPLNVAIKEQDYLPYVVECYVRLSDPVRPTVECVRGLLTVHMQTTDAAYSLRLILSDGQTVTSSLMTVPRRLGGPAKLYYQAIEKAGPSPIAVEEFASDGKILKVTRILPRLPLCARRGR